MDKWCVAWSSDGDARIYMEAVEADSKWDAIAQALDASGFCDQSLEEVPEFWESFDAEQWCWAYWGISVTAMEI